MKKGIVRFVDLFAGMGGIRLGFEEAFRSDGYATECVLTAEIKDAAIIALNQNFKHAIFKGDVAEMNVQSIPDFDYLLAGFPCQAFSVAGKQRGFMDTRGTLFFEIERILKAKMPHGFILENVEGLINHDRLDKTQKIGRTLDTILAKLKELGYKLTWKVLNAKNFGVAQNRSRVYIVGTINHEISLNDFDIKTKTFGEIMEHGLPSADTNFTRLLFKKYKPEELYGKAIKDKRGGDDNIHSWDLELRGKTLNVEKEFLNILLKERRKKKWAAIIGIDWMDGMPLTVEQISTFYPHKDLGKILDSLLRKGYLAFEHPKKRVQIESKNSQHILYERVYDVEKPKGYNIVTGKLSFDFSRIIDPNSIAPTLVAMDMSTIGVVDGKGLRHLTLREGLRLFGYPETYSLEIFETSISGHEKGFDLLGNTVCVPVIESIGKRLSMYHNDFGRVKRCQ